MKIDLDNEFVKDLDKARFILGMKRKQLSRELKTLLDDKKIIKLIKEGRL